MRLLLINPNTSSAITELVAGHARRIAGLAVEVRAVSARFGAAYIASRAAAAIGAHAALDALAQNVEGCQAVLLACFGDPGLLALREISPVPVVGMAEASCLEAARGGARFSIVTGGPRWGPMLGEFVSGLGLSTSLASIRTVAPSGAAIAADPDRALEALDAACRDCVVHDGADRVILGGAGLVGLSARLGPYGSARVICSLEAAMAAVLAAARAGPVTPGEQTQPPVPSTGLSPALARQVAG